MEKNWISLLNSFLFGTQIHKTLDSNSLHEPYINKEAAVVDAILPGKSGRIACAASLWPARCTHPLSLMPNAVVKVTGRDNITLLVEPVYDLLTTASPKHGS